MKILKRLTVLPAVIAAGLVAPFLFAAPGDGPSQDPSQTSQAEPAPPGFGGLKYVRVPPGNYMRGFQNTREDTGFTTIHRYSISPEDNAEKPGHRVEITKGFDISTVEIPVALFRRFVNETGYTTDAEKNGGAFGFIEDEDDFSRRYQQEPRFTWRDPGFEQTPTHPVTCVSWNDAQAFCKWLSKKENAKIRLPTEAEWEYAARAGSDSWYSWGNDPDGAYEHANVADAALEQQFAGMTSYQRAVRLDPDEGDGVVFTAQVGSFKPNPWGLYDMHGNVWEWCRDRFEEKVYETQLKGLDRRERREKGIKDPVQLEKTNRHEHGDWRSLRGGAWNCAPGNTRSSIRAFYEAGEAAVYTGFRVVRER
jgi:formylglycine-generating enzyme required for sulfatase activity